LRAAPGGPIEVAHVKYATALLATALLIAPRIVAAADAERSALDGIWLTDQGDGTVDIAECGDRLCGSIYSIIRLPDPSRPPLDARNEDPALRSRPLCGIPIFGGMQRLEPGKWGDGWIYDPHDGKTYHADLTLESPNQLAVHGHVGVSLLGRTVYWTRMPDQVSKCLPPR